MKTKLFFGVGGFVAGMVVCGLTMFSMMPGMMLTVHESRYDTVEETCMHLTNAIAAEGWNSPGVRDMKKAMAKYGQDYPGEVRIVELCRADYAKRVLTTNPEVLTLMPCAWGVYKGDNGKVYISGMNMGLMGKMFGGTIAEVMGGAVAKDEHKMLSSVVAH